MTKEKALDLLILISQYESLILSNKDVYTKVPDHIWDGTSDACLYLRGVVLGKWEDAK